MDWANPCLETAAGNLALRQGWRVVQPFTTGQNPWSMAPKRQEPLTIWPFRRLPAVRGLRIGEAFTAAEKALDQSCNCNWGGIRKSRLSIPAPFSWRAKAIWPDKRKGGN